jgi:hypothetical protein
MRKEDKEKAEVNIKLIIIDSFVLFFYCSVSFWIICCFFISSKCSGISSLNAVCKQKYLFRGWQCARHRSPCSCVTGLRLCYSVWLRVCSSRGSDLTLPRQMNCINSYTQLPPVINRLLTTTQKVTNIPAISRNLLSYWRTAINLSHCE